MKITVCRKGHFNAAHRLHNPEWTEEQNQRVFGLCNLPHYHGHNYNLTVKVYGETDPATGYLIDTKILKDLIREEVEDSFDHRNLNLDIADFKTLNPTVENIAYVIWHRLNKQLKQYKQILELTVVLYETERNFVEYSGE